MLSIRIDQFEFVYPDAEEKLEIDVSKRSRFPHPDVKAFAGSTIGVPAASALPEPVPFYRMAERGSISEYLERFARIDVSRHCDWATHILSEGSWDEVHLIICMPDAFVRYHWSTSA